MTQGQHTCYEWQWVLILIPQHTQSEKLSLAKTEVIKKNC